MLVGREREVHALCRATERIVFVTGDSGIGKSSVITEARNHLSEVASAEVSLDDGSAEHGLARLARSIIDNHLGPSTVPERVGEALVRLRDAYGGWLGVARAQLVAPVTDKIPGPLAEGIEAVTEAVLTDEQSGARGQLAEISSLDRSRAFADLFDELARAVPGGGLLAILGECQRMSDADVAFLLAFCGRTSSQMSCWLEWPTATVAQKTALNRAIQRLDARAAVSEIGPLSVKSVAQLLDREGIDPANAEEARRVTDGSPSFLQGYVQSVKSGSPYGGMGQERLSAEQRFVAFVKSSWMDDFDPPARERIWRLALLESRLPLEGFPAFFADDPSACGALLAQLLETRLFSPSGEEEPPWFHDQRRRIITDLLPNDLLANVRTRTAEGSVNLARSGIGTRWLRQLPQLVPGREVLALFEGGRTGEWVSYSPFAAVFRQDQAVPYEDGQRIALAIAPHSFRDEYLWGNYWGWLRAHRPSPYAHIEPLRALFRAGVRASPVVQALLRAEGEASAVALARELLEDSDLHPHAVAECLRTLGPEGEDAAAALARDPNSHASVVLVALSLVDRETGQEIATSLLERGGLYPGVVAKCIGMAGENASEFTAKVVRSYSPLQENADTSPHVVAAALRALPSHRRAPEADRLLERWQALPPNVLTPCLEVDCTLATETASALIKGPFRAGYEAAYAAAVPLLPGSELDSIGRLFEQASLVGLQIRCLERMPARVAQERIIQLVNSESPMHSRLLAECFRVFAIDPESWPRGWARQLRRLARRTLDDPAASQRAKAQAFFALADTDRRLVRSTLDRGALGRPDVVKKCGEVLGHRAWEGLSRLVTAPDAPGAVRAAAAVLLPSDRRAKLARTVIRGAPGAGESELFLALVIYAEGQLDIEAVVNGSSTMLRRFLHRLRVRKVELAERCCTAWSAGRWMEQSPSLVAEVLEVAPDTNPGTTLALEVLRAWDGLSSERLKRAALDAWVTDPLRVHIARGILDEWQSHDRQLVTAALGPFWNAPREAESVCAQILRCWRSELQRPPQPHKDYPYFGHVVKALANPGLRSEAGAVCAEVGSLAGELELPAELVGIASDVVEEDAWPVWSRMVTPEKVSSTAARWHDPDRR